MIFFETKILHLLFSAFVVINFQRIINFICRKAAAQHFVAMRVNLARGLPGKRALFASLHQSGQIETSFVALTSPKFRQRNFGGENLLSYVISIWPSFEQFEKELSSILSIKRSNHEDCADLIGRLGSNCSVWHLLKILSLTYFQTLKICSDKFSF